MKHRLFRYALAAYLLCFSPATAEESIDIEARRESVANLETHIGQREQRLAEWAKDVEKYESDGGSYWNGYYYENSRISEDWKQNRRDSSGSDKQRKDTAKALGEALERLDERRRSLNSRLAEDGKLSESARKLYTTELGQADAYHDHISAQLRDVVAGGGGAEGRAVGPDQAHDIENMIDDARKDLREDVARLFRSYDQFVRGRAYLEGLKESLVARKEWLEKNTP